ncbi:hypothetical protein J6590_106154 [Homalodisca vitripennis]|nr:hypothetical protein J6590_106154 [Homalodisca vitripennis]
MIKTVRTLESLILRKHMESYASSSESLGERPVVDLSVFELFDISMLPRPDFSSHGQHLNKRGKTIIFCISIKITVLGLLSSGAGLGLNSAPNDDVEDRQQPRDQQ